MRLEDILDSGMVIYAHVANGTRETLKEHIDKCYKYYKNIRQEKDIDKIIQRFFLSLEIDKDTKEWQLAFEMIEDIVLFHDIGKINPAFQLVKMKNNTKIKNINGVNATEHSFLSSLCYMDFYYNKIGNEISNKIARDKLYVIMLEMAYVICKHHGSFECIYNYIDKIYSNDVDDIFKELRNCQDILYLGPSSISKTILRKLSSTYSKTKQSFTHTQNLNCYFFTRFIYSLLVSCDYYATTEVINGIERNTYGNINNINKFSEEYERSDIVKSIRESSYEKCGMNELRCSLFLDTEKEYLENEEENMFFLEAPTGSGKSNMALNLSFHMMKHQKKILYIYPYNTLVEQNRKNLMDMFNDSELRNQIVVVNSITPIGRHKEKEEDSTNYYQNALLDRQFLTYPFILSTHVSFFNMLFSSNKEDLFGFLQLSDAVVVLDEIQSYKNSIWAEIIIALRACATLMGMEIIIMSATLPKLDLLTETPEYSIKLVKNPEKYFSNKIFMNRVKLDYRLLKENINMEILFLHVKNNYKHGQKTLMEFITKKSADDFYNMIEESNEIDIPVFKITGDDSIYDREKILEPIRNNTCNECILIATQVVEAGVDIDMDVGYKNISKLDSEEQFIGRINRSFKRTGIVYFFELDEAKNIYKNDCRAQNVELTLKNCEMREVLEEKCFNKYYENVLSIIKIGRNESTGKEGLDSFYKEVKELDYTAIQSRMQLIDNDNWNRDVFFNRNLIIENNVALSGKEVWNNYKKILNSDMEYAKKQVLLSDVKCMLNRFIYSVPKRIELNWDDEIGDLIYIEDGERCFANGQFNRKLLEGNDNLFI